MAFWVSCIKGLKDVAKTSGESLLHPLRTGRSAINLTLGATAASTIGYSAWNYFLNDKPVGRTLSEMVIGKDAVDEIASDTKDLSSSLSNAKETLNEVKKVTSETKNMFSGLTEFFKNFKSDNVGGMIENFLSNLINGKVSFTSILGLIISSFMVFGRFSWMGKIAGALIGAMTIGNNSKLSPLKTIKNSESLNEDETLKKEDPLKNEKVGNVLDLNDIEFSEQEKSVSRGLKR